MNRPDQECFYELLDEVEQEVTALRAFSDGPPLVIARGILLVQEVRRKLSDLVELLGNTQAGAKR